MKITRLISLSVLSIIFMITACKKDTFEETPGLKCPEVILTSPLNNETKVPVAQAITVTFNEEMNPSTMKWGVFTLRAANDIQGVVAYDSSNATLKFTPNNPLSPNTTFIGKVTTDAKDRRGNRLQEDYIWTFSTGDTLAPMVIITSPVNNAVLVPFNKVVTAGFSMVMDPTSLNASTFKLEEGVNAITGQVSYVDSTTSFIPVISLLPNTTYTATITTGAKSTSGIPLANDYVWTFRTQDTLTPIVISTSPVNNEQDVLINKTVTATFNQVMDPLTITTSSFLLKQGANSILGAVTFSGSTASFNPNSSLASNTLYTATITTLAKTPSGVAMVNDYTWTFRTQDTLKPLVISTSPFSNETNVAVNKTVTANFNQSMDPLTITSSSFLLKQGANTVPGAVSYSGTTASYNPTSDLAGNTVYTATITTIATSASGLAMQSNYVWSFTTVSLIVPPPVNLKSALNFGILAGVGVSNNAGFSEIHDMNVGIYPGVRSSITGFPPAIVVNGVILASDDIAPPGTAALLLQAKTDLTDAYLYAEGATSPAPATVSGDQGGLTLAPGIYKSTTTLLIQNGNLTLDAQGDPNAYWIFQIASAFTTVGGAGGSVILAGGAKASNIFWQVGSSAVIGDGTIFKGNILALTSITMNSTAVAEGRMLARNGSVVLTNTNIITKP